MDRKLITATIALFSLIAFPLTLSAQRSHSEAYSRAYSKAAERDKKERKLLIPDFNYHIETGLSLSSALALNDLTPAIPALHEHYAHLVPEVSLRMLFRTSGLGNIGAEVGVAYITAPALSGVGSLFKAGLCTGSVKSISKKWSYISTVGLGYIGAHHNVKGLPEVEAFNANSHGIYASTHGAVMVNTSHKTAVGLSVGLDVYHLWDWRLGGNLPATDHKPGFGLYPTVGVVCYFGGL